jgi:ABC-type transport system, involved in lipoprotein release, permease component
MKEIIKIAWRNLWRNKRRTIITASSIFFSIFFAILMRSFQLGTYDHMIRQSIESYSGYLQVQNTEFKDDPTLDNTIDITPEQLSAIKSDPNVKVAVPRIESFSLASTGTLSKGVMVAAISPALEKNMTNPEHNLVRYIFSGKAIDTLKSNKDIPKDISARVSKLKDQSFTNKKFMAEELELNSSDSLLINIISSICSIKANYLNENDSGLLVSYRLSQYLKVSVGDSIVLMGQGYQGMSAAGLFPVRGIIKVPSPDLDNKLIYMTLSNAEGYLSAYGKLTSIAINLKNTDEMTATQERVSAIFDNQSEIVVKNWEEISPVLKQQIEGDSNGGILFIMILYVIIFFGIFGTVQMMISERKREFGVMISLGMKKGRLALIIITEMLFLGSLGIFSGMVASIPFMLYGHIHPIRITGELAKIYIDMGFDPVMPMLLFESYFFIQAAVVFLMVLAATILPVRSILKINIIKALHG